MNIDPPKLAHFLALKDYKGDDILIRTSRIVAIEGDRKLFQCTVVCSDDSRLLVNHKPDVIADMIEAYETQHRQLSNPTPSL